MILNLTSDVSASKQYQQLLSNDTNNAKGLKQAFLDILKVFFVENEIRFDLMVVGNVSQHLIDAVSYISDAIIGNLSFPITIRKIPNITHWVNVDKREIIVIKNSLFLVLTQDALETFDIEGVLRTDSPMDVKIFIYGHDANYMCKNFDGIYSSNEGKVQLYQYFIYNTGDSLVLYTYEWYTAEVCNKMHKKELNRFNFTAVQWKVELKAHKKFQNFHKCNIISNIAEDNDYIMNIAGEVRNFNDFRHYKLFTMRNDKLIPDIPFYKNFEIEL